MTLKETQTVKRGMREKQDPPLAFSHFSLLWIAWVIRWTRLKNLTPDLNPPLLHLPIHTYFVPHFFTLSTPPKRRKLLPKPTFNFRISATGFRLREKVRISLVVIRYLVLTEEITGEFQFIKTFSVFDVRVFIHSAFGISAFD